MVRAPRPNPAFTRSITRFCREKGLNLNGGTSASLENQLKEAMALQAYNNRHEEKARALEALLEKLGK